MTVKLASLKADLSREEKGDWIDYPAWDGVAFNVSSLQKPAYTIARDLMFQRLARKYKKKPIPEAVRTTELGKLYHVHILHDWRGFDTAFSAETALQTLTSPEYRDVVAAVEWCAAKVSEIEVEYLEDEAGNSEQPSAAA